jgi:hypothetical protein
MRTAEEKFNLPKEQLKNHNHSLLEDEVHFTFMRLLDPCLNPSLQLNHKVHLSLFSFYFFSWPKLSKFIITIVGHF